MEKNKRVLLGMSGGTDSSVAAMLLLEAGYEVTGVTFRFYEFNGSTEYLEDARALAARLGIGHITYDARKVFQEQIIDYFIDEYMSGHTPVPCTLCNNQLKWPLLAKIADEMGIFYLATGHYVRKQWIDGNYYIAPAEDVDKDQSFFLWGLRQEILQRMLLPMGGMTKSEARAYAAGEGRNNPPVLGKHLIFLNGTDNLIYHRNSSPEAGTAYARRPMRIRLCLFRRVGF